MGKGKKKGRNAFMEQMAAAPAAGDDVGQEEEGGDGGKEMSRKEKRELKAAKKAAREKEAREKEEQEKAKAAAAANDDSDGQDGDQGADDSNGGTVFYGNPEDEGPAVVAQEEDDSTPKKGRGKAGKLSNKERRKLKEQQEAADRDAAIANKPVKATEFSVSATIAKQDEAWLNATDINIPSFNISAYGKTLFQNAELKIAAGRKYGIVGPNGKGKSTLLMQLANGELAIPPKIDCLYVEQEVTADDTPAVEMVLKADTRRTELMTREAEIIDLLESEAGLDLSMQEHEDLQEELKQVTDELRARGNDSAEAKALMLLNGLGFTKEMQRAPTKTFSGGWRMRVSIARALFLAPTLMLLDEPTNHLDLNAVLWLDNYLQKWKKTLIIVSHDEDFLDSVCTDIIHLDQLRLFYYRGNYSQFKGQVHLHKEKMIKDWKEQERKLKAMKSKGASKKQAAQKLASKSKREAGASKRGKGAADSAQETTTDPNSSLMARPKDYVVQFTFPEPNELPPPIISVENVSFGYPGGKALFKKLEFGIDMDSRITIVGNNGVGKTTLLKVITGELTPTKGEVKINRHLRMARYHQHFLDILPPGESPVDFLRREHDCTYQEARNRLGKFGLEGHAHTITMNKCSGGQKSRVVFASMSFQNPHMLILDEPTNNLDLESIEALIEAINEFDGGVIVVTHDARLIQETECRLWVVEDRDVYEQIGGFDAYRDKILAQLEKEAEEEARIIKEKQQKAEELRAKRLKDVEEKRKKKLAAANPPAPPS